MKKIVCLVTILFALVSCKKVADGEFLLTGSAKGIANGKTVIIKKQNELGIVVNVDSTKIKDGKFELKGKVKDPNLMVLFIKGLQQPIPFILESGAIEVTVDKDSIWKSEIGGTYNNDEFQKFNTQMNGIQKKLVAYQNANFQKLMMAQQKKDQATIDNLKKGFSVLQKEMETFVSNYPKENKEAFISLLLLKSQLKSPNFKLDAFQKDFNNLDASLKNSKIGKELQKEIKLLEKNSTETAATNSAPTLAPDFSSKSPNGQTVSLLKSLGKVTILDFWASWCGPCRKENPNVVAIYKEFHDKGLNIVGVSLDDDATKWKQAIAKDGITWVQVSNLKGWDDPIAKLYHVEQIPTTFILDEKGAIIAKDLRGEALRTKISELLK
ncbi:TlpA disulfide reductase family protein [Flavobacterium aciduliphilum]|uniref:Peroxiredoxin n=1 Tax=Flavobacterium aciduliphilum TaxID=1101402 RepID=A0A328YH43_9FLAO|nr:TlpA disulfide reductase family protein [Flavobacterium aciduliphilum]RAR70007.1 peroxiredoxin [Flavobacterium aciduliphilum]